jgi:hypothetical protein
VRDAPDRLTRRTLLQAPVLAGLALQRPASNAFPSLASGLLADWGDGLLRLQIDEPRNLDRHGAFRCPACGTLHGRCGDAVYPLLRLAHTTGRARYLEAARRVVGWMRNVESPDGAWTNDPHSPTSWKGITVFAAIAFAEALRHHGELLDKPTREAWRARLLRAAQFIFANFTFDYANINYPITASYALTLLGELFDEPKFRARGRELAHGALAYFTPGKLLSGEGHPQKGRSPKGLLPIDLGYNVEESLPALALYGLATRDEEVLQATTAAMAAHLEFMLPDGAWDNSWGTRSFKWTYWGSRTSDGCQTAYALLADRDPAFAAAAFRNTQLLRACTHDGLLHGGPHHARHGVPPCVHHTFCHSKALATVLDRRASWGGFASGATLPRERARGVRTIADLDSRLVARGPWRATISGYDWLYKKDVFSGMGGALSMLWHARCGPLLSASLATYVLAEPNNMQPRPAGPDFCLTPRVETRTGGWFSNIFFPGATLVTEEHDDRITCVARTRLVDAHQKDPAGGPRPCELRYQLGDAVTIAAEVPGADGPFTLIVPLISPKGEAIRRLSDRRFEVTKAEGTVIVEADAPIAIADVGGDRVFNLVPGLAAIPFVVTLPRAGRASCTLRVR